jgi:precorrin-4 C11-methyltransferase
MSESKRYNVIFAGAGPGAADLITVRCQNTLKQADLVIYAGSLVNPDILADVSKNCRCLSSADLDLNGTSRLIQEYYELGKRVVRLHTGEPAIYGAIAEQMNELDKLNIPYEIIPGISSAFASAAALKSELTMAGVSQTVILTRRAGRTPVPDGESIPELAAHQATMCIYLTINKISELVNELLEGGYSKTTAIGVVYRASWGNEKIIRGTLADIAGKVTAAGVTRQAMIIVGDVLKRGGEKSKLYSSTFSHEFRDKKDNAGIVFRGDIAIYAITNGGCQVARNIQRALPNTTLFVPTRFSVNGEETFDKGEFTSRLTENWQRYAGHIFVMSTGIVVRKLMPLIESKTKDPAVVVCDEQAQHAISLLSGHIGGANRLAKRVAGIIGAAPVITTATDVQGVVAFDEMAAIQGWRVENPELIKVLNSMLLEKKKIGVVIPEHILKEYYGNNDAVIYGNSVSELLNKSVDGVVILDNEVDSTLPVLKLRST